MVFSALLFLFAYLPAVMAGYYIVFKRLAIKWRNAYLFIVSLIFYAWGEPVYVLLMLFATIFGWAGGIILERFWDDPPKAKAALVINITISLGLLGFFKYGNFVIANINRYIGLGLPPLDLPLPIGISFYTFQIISYTVDVYRKQVPSQRSIVNYGAYIAMFPQLIAGPIVRYNTILLQLDDRSEDAGSFGKGAGSFVVGLSKKVLLANNIGVFWEAIRSGLPDELTVLAAWSGILAFGLQLYFDFSGYSDMAVGLGRMLGFEFERNFDYPYISGSITEFWRRWHISLGTWFREYLYIPLGGSRLGDRRTILNLLIVWAATGFWHGANWNYIFWGLYYFVFLVCEKYLWAGLLERTPKALRHIYVLVIVMIGWALFVFEDLTSLGVYCRALFGFAGGGFMDTRILYYLYSWRLVLIVSIVGATPIAAGVLTRLEGKRPGYAAVLKPALMLIGLVLSTAYIVDSSYNPFLYFRF